MHFASSGDPVLDRRYGRAKAALEDGDPQAAVEILDQTVAQLRKKLGDTAASPRWLLTIHGVGYMLADQ